LRTPVLAWLPSPVRQVNKHRHVLARCDGRQRATVDRFQNEGNDIVRLLDTAYDAVLARRLIGVHIRLLIQPRLLRDQLKSEQPIDLTPGRGDLIGMRRYDRCTCLHYAERLR
jgi:hypothetical protein